MLSNPTEQHTILVLRSITHMNKMLYAKGDTGVYGGLFVQKGVIELEKGFVIINNISIIYL